MVMWTCLEVDNQLSLRYSMEWLVVLLFHKYPHSLEGGSSTTDGNSLCTSQYCLQSVIHTHSQGTGKRLSRLCSVFTVAMHYGMCLEEDSDKVGLTRLRGWSCQLIVHVCVSSCSTTQQCSQQ